MWLTLDKDGQQPMGRQLYKRIRQMILQGTLAPAARLPSSRALAHELGLARNTVLEAYDQLLAEGYLEARQGSGTRVACGIAAVQELPEQHPAQLPMAPTVHPAQSAAIIHFRSGIPALDAFPRREWAKTYQHVCEIVPEEALRYCAPAGVLALRQALCGYLQRTRGISCSPERIMITTGATQGLQLVARLLRAQGNTALVEDPVHTGLREVVIRSGYALESIRADQHGMDTTLLPAPDAARRAGVAFVYTTPSHQYPLGGILPIARRQQLVRFAREAGCNIIEDDYDSEFRHEGAPVSSLYELAPETVIYLGSCSKILAPALRLGFAILPARLLAAWHTEKLYTDVHTDALSQYALAAFIESGALEKHTWKMKKLYRRKRAFLVQALTRSFGNAFTVQGHAAGLHMVAGFPGVHFTPQLVDNLRAQGVEVAPVEAHSLRADGRHAHEIILGYAHLSESAMERGVQILHRVLAEHL